MSGQQHSYLSGFPNVQQSAMRTPQTFGGQMVPNLISHSTALQQGPQQGSKYFKIVLGLLIVS